MIINIRHLYVTVVHNFYLSLIKNINQIYFKFKFLNFDNFFYFSRCPAPPQKIILLCTEEGQDNENYGNMFLHILGIEI